ncbi:uncharacterized protein BXZ73DRAFT_105540 [Epithele typhae]|uniref:uncharacterized protein n=1 Tax=Epithele typhae TaxID=378194 RepID=UPI0020086889|nr:uncharacterized protein BXZ73DRAFT_105540 [Epithele typhae]KAH9917378.1 hypothetical protein BXZ73DRAFT_105540 [Epithele typhae]
MADNVNDPTKLRIPQGDPGLPMPQDVPTSRPRSSARVAGRNANNATTQPEAGGAEKPKTKTASSRPVVDSTGKSSSDPSGSGAAQAAGPSAPAAPAQLTTPPVTQVATSTAPTTTTAPKTTKQVAAIPATQVIIDQNELIIAGVSRLLGGGTFPVPTPISNPLANTPTTTVPPTLEATVSALAAAAPAACIPQFATEEFVFETPEARLAQAALQANIVPEPRGCPTGSPKVDRAIKAGQYTPYTHVVAENAFTHRKETTLASVLTASSALDPTGELSLDCAKWSVASKAVERCMDTHHGAARAEVLRKHHTIVEGIGADHSWEAALRYDSQMRRIWVMSPYVDIGIHDPVQLAIALNAMAEKKIDARFQALPQQGQRAHVGAGGRGYGAGYGATTTGTARAAPYDDAPRKWARVESRCFRCGGTGHMPSACVAATTVTGRPTAPRLLGGRSPHALIAPDNTAFCFGFARGGNTRCAQGAACVNYHGCSICGDTRHGAAACNPSRGDFPGASVAIAYRQLRMHLDRSGDP